VTTGICKKIGLFTALLFMAFLLFGQCVYPLNRAEGAEATTLATLTLTGDLPTSFYTGDNFDLNQLKLTGQDGDGLSYDLTDHNVLWESSTPVVAFVYGEVLTAVEPGQTQVTASVEGIRSNPLDFTVASDPTVAEVAVSSIEISGPANILVPISGTDTASYTATVRDQDGNEMTEESVVWSVQDPVSGGAVPGLSVDPLSGVVEVDSTVQATEFNLKATSNTDNSVYLTMKIDLKIYITGKVINFLTGSEVPGARIQMGAEQAIADAAGNYIFTEINIGNSYSLTVSADGFLSRTVGPIYISESRSIRQNIGVTPQNVDVGKIEGYISYVATGSNLANVEVKLDDLIYVRSDSSGFYRISDVPVGKTSTLSVSCINYLSRVVNGIRAGEGMDFALARVDDPVGYISGKVTNLTNGAGVPRARVSAGFGLVAITDEEGNYNLDNLPEGSYCLQAYSDNYESATAAAAVASGDTAVHNLELKPNAGAGWISGQVWNIEDTGQRLNGALVTIGDKTVMTQRKPGQYNSYYEMGYYFIKGIAPGNYEIAVSLDGYHSRQTSAVTIEQGAGTNFNIALTPATVGITLTGIVKSSLDGTPLAGAKVWVCDGTYVLSDSEGRYTITDLPTDSYDITASRSGYRERKLNDVWITSDAGAAFEQNIALTPQNIDVEDIQGYVSYILLPGLILRGFV